MRLLHATDFEILILAEKVSNLHRSLELFVPSHKELRANDYNVNSSGENVINGDSWVFQHQDLDLMGL